MGYKLMGLDINNAVCDDILHVDITPFRSKQIERVANDIQVRNRHIEAIRDCFGSEVDAI